MRANKKGWYIFTVGDLRVALLANSFDNATLKIDAAYPGVGKTFERFATEGDDFFKNVNEEILAPDIFERFKRWLRKKRKQ